MDEKCRLFVDMDGTVAEFQTVDTLETLYEEKYFLNLKPQQNVLNAIKKIIHNHPEIEVNILSSVLTDSKYALKEKNEWLDRYLPEIKSDHRFFPPCGADKKEYISGSISDKDFLLDDYSVNLKSWEPPAHGIKIMNGLNGTKGTWQSDKLSIMKSSDELADNIINIIRGTEHYEDIGPVYQEAKWSIDSVTLEKEGYAYADILVNEFVNGKVDQFKTEGYFRISDLENGKNMKLVHVDENIFLHPVLKTEWETIEKHIAKEVVKEQALYSFSEILGVAKEEILRSQSLWGAWLGRIVNSSFPEEYIDVDVEGVTRTNEVNINLVMINGNKKETCINRTINIDNLEKETLDQLFAKANVEMIPFLVAQAEKIADHSDEETFKGCVLYSNGQGAEERYADHYKLLEERGYDKFPDKSISTEEKETPIYHARKGR